MRRVLGPPRGRWPVESGYLEPCVLADRHLPRPLQFVNFGVVPLHLRIPFGEHDWRSCMLLAP